ncbi:MAG: transcription elongation factor GreA [Candidatus Omnitrophica bacterium]|nr:transcription elongation factor GreA [Candidatus Omnitrophota bacterium]
MERVHLTQEGYERLVEELEDLKNTKRKEISKAIEHARSLGDLKENAEYHAAKEAMAENEKRISELEEKLSRAEIIDDTKIDTDRAFIGARLKLLDTDTDEEVEYTLVGQDEANAARGLISITSPVGKSLLGHEVGDTIEIEVPAGTLTYKLIDISR